MNQRTQNILLSIIFYITFCYDFYAIILKSLRGFNTFNMPIIFLYALITMGLLHFLSKKIYESIEWEKISKIAFGINSLLFLYLLFLTISNLNNDTGLSKALWYSAFWRGWAGPETHYYFKPIVGYIGLVITIFTYLQIRLSKVNLVWKVLFWLPQIAYIILLLVHFYGIRKPVFYG